MMKERTSPGAQLCPKPVREEMRLLRRLAFGRWRSDVFLHWGRALAMRRRLSRFVGLEDEIHSLSMHYVPNAPGLASELVCQHLPSLLATMSWV